VTRPLFALLRHPLLDDPRTNKVLGFLFAAMVVGILYCAIGVRVRRGKGGLALALFALGVAALVTLGSVAFVSSIIYRVRPDELVRLSSALCAPAFVGLAAAAITINRLATRRGAAGTAAERTALADSPVQSGYAAELAAPGDPSSDVVAATGVFLVSMLGTLALTVTLAAVAGT
jgi:hypothetical protein